MNTRFEPAHGLSGKLRPPADKSISHRAGLLGAMSSEPVRIENYLEAADTRSTLEAVRALGALVEENGAELVIRGTGLREAREPEQPIDVGNAGTLLRLLPGWLAAQQGRSFTLDGDESIRRRPVDRIALPLRAMGARLDARDGRFAPFTIHGERLLAVDHDLDVASAQVKSCLLMAALTADGTTTVAEPSRSRDHTERMLLRAGVAIAREGNVVTAANVDELALESVAVPADPSSAAFFVAAGVLVPGSRSAARRRRRELDAHGLPADRATHARDRARRPRGRVRGDRRPRSRPASWTSPTARWREPSWTPEEVPLAIDELPLVGAAGLLRRGRHRRDRSTGAAGEGVRPHRRRRRRPARARR